MSDDLMRQLAESRRRWIDIGDGIGLAFDRPTILDAVEVNGLMDGGGLGGFTSAARNVCGRVVAWRGVTFGHFSRLVDSGARTGDPVGAMIADLVWELVGISPQRANKMVREWLQLADGEMRREGQERKN